MNAFDILNARLRVNTTQWRAGFGEAGNVAKSAAQGMRESFASVATSARSAVASIATGGRAASQAIGAVGAQAAAVMQPIAGALNAVGGALQRIQGVAQQTQASLVQVGASLNVVAGGLGKIGGVARQTAQDLAAVGAAATAAMAAITVQSQRTGADFEYTMSTLKALLSGSIPDAGQLAEAMASAQQQARDLGKSTQFSASQVGQAMNAMARSGFDATQVYEAMPAVLDLAAAGGLEVAQAADIAAKVMRGMQIPTKDLTHVVDVLAKASTSAGLPMVDLGTAMRYVGPLATSAGMSIEKTTAFIAILQKRGMEASMAGTGLRGVLSNLLEEGRPVREVFGSLGVELKNVDGSLRPLEEILRDTSAALKAQGREAEFAELAMKAFGDRAGPAFINMMGEATAEAEALTNALENSGGSGNRVAAILRDNMKGSLEQLSGALEEIQLKISAATGPAVRSLVDGFTQWLNVNDQMIASGVIAFFDSLTAAVSNVAGAVNFFTQQATGLGSVLDPVRATLADLYAQATAMFASMPEWAQQAVILVGGLGAIGTVLTTIGGAVPIVGILFTAVGNLINPFALVGKLVSVLAGVFTTLWGVVSTVVSLVSALWTALSGLGAILGGGVIAAIGAIPIALGAVVVAIGMALATSETAREKMGVIWEALSSTVVGILTKLWEAMKSFWDKYGDTIVRTTSKVGELILTLTNFLMPVITTVANFTGDVLVNAFDLLGDAIGFVFNAIELVVDVLTGDWDSAARSFYRLVGSMIDIVAGLIESLGKLTRIFTFGAVDLSTFSDGLREHANELRAYSDEADKAREAEEKLAEAQESRYKQGKARTFQEEQEQKLKEMKGVHEQENVTIKESFERQRAAIRHDFSGGRNEGMEGQRDQMLANVDAEEQRALAKADKRHGTAAAEQKVKIKQAAWQQEEAERIEREHQEKEKRRFLRNQYAADGKPVPDHLKEPEERTPKIPAPPMAVGGSIPGQPTVTTTPIVPQRITAARIAPPMAVGGQLPAQVASPSGSTVAIPVQGSATGNPGQTAVAGPIQVSDGMRRALNGANRETALKLFEDMKRQMAEALKPDAMGKISDTAAQAILEKFRAVFAEIPGFSEKAFAEMSEKAKAAMAGMTTAPGELQAVFGSQLDQALGGETPGGAVFQDPAGKTKERAEALATNEDGFAQKKQVEWAQMMKMMVSEAKKSGAELSDLKELTGMKNAIMDRMNELKGLHGEQRKAAADEVAKMVEDYNAAYDKILKKAKDTADGQKKSAKDGAEGSSKEQKKAADSAGGSSGGHQAAVAAGQAMSAPTNEVFGMAQGLSNMFAGAMGGVGQGMAAFGQVLDSVKDPLQKLDLLIQNANARLGGASINAGNFGGVGSTDVTQIRSEIAQLNKQRVEVIARQNKEAANAKKEVERAYQSREAQKEEQSRIQRREAGLDMASLVTVGKKAGSVVFNTYGVHDDRDLLKRVEKEMRRMGFERGPNRTIANQRGV